MLRLIYLLALVIAALSSSAQDLTPEIRAEIDRRINFQRNWDRVINSPGAELQAVDITPTDARKGRVLRFELHTRGLSQDLEYELAGLPTMASSPDELNSLGTVHIDKKDGRVMNGPDDPFCVILADPAPGEPYRFAVISNDGKQKAAITLLPNPIEAGDKGCKVRVVRLMPKFELAFVQLTGFPGKTEVTFRGDSEGEIHEGPVKIDDEGYGDIAILPAKKGKSQGTMKIQITSPTCAPKVKFDWGTTH